MIPTPPLDQLDTKQLRSLAAQLLIDGLEVEVQLAGKLGLKVHRLQLHHHIAMQARVIEKQV